ncbi:MAG TPA: response regulator [Ilumatobacteraceae bacterium]|nr:response regulator [Ilumatobacteraceae bacterium]
MCGLASLSPVRIDAGVTGGRSMRGDTPSRDNGQPILIAGSIALGLGIVATFLIAVTASGGPYWSIGLQLTVYMFAAVALAGVLGLIFAVPRARTESVEQTTERYSANSNLEQISDWLTKILVGAGLVQLGSLPSGLGSMGDFLGEDLGIPNAEAAAVTIVLYGAGTGFLFVYLWVRLRLRVLLELSEKQAEEQSRQEEVAASLTVASAKSTAPESPTSISRAASEATAAVQRRPSADFRSILWVDDFPQNNNEIVHALTTLGIPVDSALSTEEALRLVDPWRHGLVITDLGRRENGIEHPDAGLELLQELRRRDISLPVFVFAGLRGVERRDELLEAGAALATNRATELFSRAVETITGSPRSAI